ncbi:hypothetical protein AAT19DRAFT_9707 [Rhodotorula toruloides]|uniref:Cysteine-rich transmembrane CYSTM domain-containing protein n=1 Tax=Rhodotorula toruloides TaxID=5286 RepID=A0A2T0A0R6_RHOTO|nr:hypothetical protein AAT19DRAFT_9707 [Rhodotorula toruloides]
MSRRDAALADSPSPPLASPDLRTDRLRTSTPRLAWRLFLFSPSLSTATRDPPPCPVSWACRHRAPAPRPACALGDAHTDPQPPPNAYYGPPQGGPPQGFYGQAQPMYPQQPPMVIVQEKKEDDGCCDGCCGGCCKCCGVCCGGCLACCALEALCD